MKQAPDTSTTSEMSADDATIIQEVVQESIQKPHHLDDLAARLIEFLLRHLVNEDTRPKFLSSTPDLCQEVNTAIIVGLEKYMSDDHPSCTETRTFLSDVKASQVSELSRLTMQGMDKIFTTIREKYRELLMYKFVFTPENIKEYAALPESHLRILIDGYFILSSPGNESKGLEDYPSFEDYLTIITPKVLKVTEGFDLVSAADLIPYIPSPLISRYSQMPVPPRILEMISERIWPAWKAVKPPKPLSPREALTLIYSLYNRFAEEKQDDEAEVVEKAIRELGFETSCNSSRMLDERRVISKCFEEFRNKYVGNMKFVTPGITRFHASESDLPFRSLAGNGTSYCIGCHAVSITDKYQLLVSLYDLSNNTFSEAIFDEIISQRSYQFLCDLFSAVKTEGGFELHYESNRYFQNSSDERDIKLLDLVLRSAKGIIRPNVLIERFKSENLTKEFIETLEKLAPKTFEEILKDLKFIRVPSSILIRNLCTSTRLFKQFYDQKTVNIILDRFVANPSINFLPGIDVLYDLRDEADEYLINRRYFDRVARAVIHKGLADLLEPASRYIKEYCHARRSSALADYGHYIENQVFEADLNKEFITKFRTNYPWVFHV